MSAQRLLWDKRQVGPHPSWMLFSVPKCITAFWLGFCQKDAPLPHSLPAAAERSALLPPARGPYPIVAWETMSSLFKALLLLPIILLFKNKKMKSL